MLLRVQLCLHCPTTVIADYVGPVNLCTHIFGHHPQIRNKLNQEQNSKLQQQKELLNKRNMEVTLMDKRISELRERLYKKKAEARQKENLPVRLGALNISRLHFLGLKNF